MSVCLSVCLCVLNNNHKFGGKKSHYQSKVFICVCNQWAYADNCADVVDRLLMFSKVKNADRQDWYILDRFR